MRGYLALGTALAALSGPLRPARVHAQGACVPPNTPRSITGTVSPAELAALVGPWQVEVIATRGRWDLNPRADSLGRATFFLFVTPRDTAGATVRVLGVRADTLRPLGGQYARAPRRRDAQDALMPDSAAIALWMYGRTLYGGHPGGVDAVYDSFELSTIDERELRGRFYRSWGIGVPLGVSGDSALPPAGYFCARRPAAR